MVLHRCIHVTVYAKQTYKLEKTTATWEVDLNTDWSIKSGMPEENIL